MEERFREIDKRVHAAENAERYAQLVAHPDAVQGGKEFLENARKAKNLLNTIRNNTDPHINYTAQYRYLIQKMTDWLNDNAWA